MDRVPVLQTRGIIKRYGHVEALRGADLDVHAGEVVGLIGDNGAGKSTLVKVLAGIERPDRGDVFVGGEPVRINSPADARAHGMEFVFQDLALAPDLNAWTNLYLGRELLRRGALGRIGWLDKAAMRRLGKQTFQDLGISIKDLDAPVATYSGGQRQAVAVARGACWARSVLVLDEPTAALGVVQTEHVLDLILRVRERGMSVVLVSHNMPDILAVCDRIEVLRLGKRVSQFVAAEATVERLVATMTGGDPAASVAAPSSSRRMTVNP